MIKAVVFDLGEVLASPPSLLPKLAERMGTSAERLAELYWPASTPRLPFSNPAPEAPLGPVHGG